MKNEMIDERKEKRIERERERESFIDDAVSCRTSIDLFTLFVRFGPVRQNYLFSKIQRKKKNWSKWWGGDAREWIWFSND